MTLRDVSIVCAAFLVLSGCAAVKDFGSSLKYNIQGEYYLQERDFAKGRQIFADAVQQDSYNPEAYFYYGRFLLAEGKAREALPYFKKAVGLNPDNSDYYFWLGVTYGELDQASRERTNYQIALRYDDDHLQALTYLGNNFLRAKEYERALVYYQKVLDIWQDSPQALYNRAVILRRLKRTPEEKLAWLHYLYAYPSGSFARRAADRLNSYEDYSFRNYKLGVRTITLADIAFVPFKAEVADAALPSLNLVGAVVNNMGKGILNIVVYQLNNGELARKRALSIRNYLYLKYPQLKKRNCIRTSWFDVAEKRRILGKTLQLDESVQFFLTKG